MMYDTGVERYSTRLSRDSNRFRLGNTQERPRTKVNCSHSTSLKHIIILVLDTVNSPSAAGRLLVKSQNLKIRNIDNSN
jgi:hypothetical protein